MPKQTKESNSLKAESLIERIEEELAARIKKLKTPPVLALIWVGDDKQTEKFVKAKQKKAALLGVQFSMHHFKKIEDRQLSALLGSLTANKKVDGIIVQLPLPKNIKEGNILNLIPVDRDVDSLNGGSFSAPTPTGIAELLKENDVVLSKSKTVIIGNGKLVGQPLAEIFRENSWSFEQISSNAESQTKKISKADVLISATGVEGLIKPDMVSSNMVVVDGSGVDVDVKEISPLVKMITPKKGAVGPLTVLMLMKNVVSSAERRQGS